MTKSDILGQFVLADEIANYRPTGGAAGRRAETLVKDERLRVVLVTMRSGAALQTHTAPGPITIHVLRGRMTVSVAGEQRTLGQGALLAIAAGAPHAVEAVEDGAFLLTIGWDGSQGRSAAEAEA